MDAGTTQDSTTSTIPFWGVVLAALGILGRKWLLKLDPRIIFVWLSEPVMKKHVAPLTAKVEKVCRVIDKMEGAQEAKAAVAQEDAKAAEWMRAA